MSNNYDNWERLVEVVLRREQDREVALADSRESSFRSISSSSRFGSDSSFREQNPQLEAYNSNTVNLLGDKMGVLGIEGRRGEEMAAKGKGIQPAFLDGIVNRLLQAAKGKGRIQPGFLDDIINRLLEPRNTSTVLVRQVQMSENEIRALCITSREIFLAQPNFLELDAPIKICGNIHGQYGDLLRIFEFGGFPPEVNYLFLGGYVDYGKQSIETICLLLAYKIKYPENFFLLRGNHECASINRKYGFYDECKRRYNVRLWKVFTDCFNCLPVAALVDKKILCMHGGLSPDLRNFDQIRTLPRPIDVPDFGLLCDLLWSDPSREVKGWAMNDRGVSYAFGSDTVTEFLKMHDLDLVCRGHQVVEDGYEFFADRQLVTIFSAPNFQGEFDTIFSAPNFQSEFDNAGAIMSVDDNLMCTFQILKPAYRRRFL